MAPDVPIQTFTAPEAKPDAASLREQLLRNIDGYTSGEMKRLLVDLLTRQRLGLYWERDLVAQDRALNENHVILTLDGGQGSGASCGAPPYRNLIIEGENFDALRLLRTTHKGRVRVILIDPPYNTGNKDFVYNDRFVRKNDAYRQSMWLDWLHRRLTLARDLLPKDGVILACINDENRAKLELLMDDVFAGMRIGSFVWKTRSGSNDSGDDSLSVDHEHILVYGGPDFEFTGASKDFRQYTNPDADPKGPWKTGDLTKGHSHRERPNAFYPLQNPATGVWYPCNPTRVWAYASEARLKPGQKTRQPSMEEWIRQDKIVWPDPAAERTVVWESKEALLQAIDAGDVPTANRGRTPLLTRDLPGLDFWVGKPVSFERPWFRRHLADVKSATSLVSSWIRGVSEKAAPADEGVAEVVTQRSGTAEDSVKEILGHQAFSFPKPPSLFRELLRYATDPDDTVLDFFAGSGTTAQAVLALNAEDDGNRRFILVSSTEATRENPDRNLCRDVCAERVRRVIKGYRNVPGLGGDFGYLRAARIDPADLLLDLTAEAAWNTLCLRHAGVVAPFPGGPVARLPVDGETAVVLCFDTNEETIVQLEALENQAVIVYTDRPDRVAEALRGDRAVEVHDVFEAVRTTPALPGEAV